MTKVNSWERWRNIRESKERVKQEALKTKEEYGELKKNSVCDILKKHHITLINDNERLSTNFILSLFPNKRQNK